MSSKTPLISSDSLLDQARQEASFLPRTDAGLANFEVTLRSHFCRSRGAVHDMTTLDVDAYQPYAARRHRQVDNFIVLDHWMRTSKAFDEVIDSDAVIRDPDYPTKEIRGSVPVISAPK
jgi:hypothetical protein